MKRAFNKIIAICLIFSFLLSFSYYVFASDPDDPFEPVQEAAQETDPNNMNQTMETGKVTSTVGDDDSGEQKQVNTASVGGSVIDAITTILMVPLVIPPEVIVLLLETAVNGKVEFWGDEVFTIQKCVTGQYDLFDINIFDLNPNNGPYDSVNKAIRENVVVWYVAMRNLALVLCAIIVIYIGLRMGLATIAEEQAKYKKMLTGWVTSLVLLFSLQYIIYILLFIADALNNFIKLGMDAMTSTFSEEQLINRQIETLFTGHASNKVLNMVLFYIIVYYQIKYFILFLTRSLRVYFLTMISPLICITYSIDIIKDNKAQAFGAWSKQMINEIFLGPIEGLVYILFVFTAGAIMQKTPMLAIIMICMMGKAEKGIQEVLGLHGMRGIHGIGIFPLFVAIMQKVNPPRRGGGKPH